VHACTLCLCYITVAPLLTGSSLLCSHPHTVIDALDLVSVPGRAKSQSCWRRRSSTTLKQAALDMLADLRMSPLNATSSPRVRALLSADAVFSAALLKPEHLKFIFRFEFNFHSRLSLESFTAFAFTVVAILQWPCHCMKSVSMLPVPTNFLVDLGLYVLHHCHLGAG